MDITEQLTHESRIALAAAAEITRLRAEVEALRGITPELPPRPPDGGGLPRYGLRHNGQSMPMSVPMADGYWTPYHLAIAEVEALRAAPQQAEPCDVCNALTVPRNATHTPGPWTPDFGETYAVIAPDGGRIAISTNLKGRHGLAGRRTGNEVECNTRLIAAAPELLEALETCVAQLKIITGQVHDERIALIKGCAAIAKATGEQA